MGKDRLVWKAYFPSTGTAIYQSTKKFSNEGYAEKYACSVMKKKMKKKGYKVIWCRGGGPKGNAHGVVEVKLPFRKRLKELFTDVIEEIE